MLTCANLNERCYPVVNGRVEGDGHSNIRIKSDALEAAISAIRSFPPLAQPCALRGEAGGEGNGGRSRRR